MTSDDTIKAIQGIAEAFSLAVDAGSDIPTEYNKARMAVQEIKKQSTETNKEMK